MNKKDPLRTIQYLTIFTSINSKNSKVLYPRLSNIDIPL